MPNKFSIYLLLSITIAVLSACSQEEQPMPEAVTAEVSEDSGNDNIAGRVTGSNGPEAGVWVIAETDDLDTPYAKIVVTNDNGDYLLPDLPPASYQIWVRGYGLVDSAAVNAIPGMTLDLEAAIAPDALTAAQYYPAGYWYSLLEIPSADEFPGTGPTGNGISPNLTHQEEFIGRVGNQGCLACHQLGNQATRTIPALFSDLDTDAAWQRRIQSGQAGSNMIRGMTDIGLEAFNDFYGSWTERIAAGALPPAPERPQGLERNLVITIWDWADPQAYMHDLVSTDRRNPSINSNGLIYGATELSTDYLPVLDPVNNRIDQVPLSMLDPSAPSVSGSMLAESPYWGMEEPWDSQTNVHNPMMDQDGRVWITARTRGDDNPAWCQQGSEHPSAQVFPLDGSGRQLGVYDPESDVYTPIDTCFSTHHLMFAEDTDNTLWTSGGGPVVGWLNTRQYLESGDAQAAQGWTPMVLDTNGNGQRDAYTEPGQPMNPEMDMRIMNGSYYAVSPAPDGSVWGTLLGYPGGVARLVPGEDPTTDALVEYYELPVDQNGSAIEGFSPRGGDVDRDGVIWVALASGQMASFDRRLCTGPLNGPEATGHHCPEGWSFYTEPLPQFQGLDREGSVEGSYYTWVDQQNTLGLGDNTPINTGNLSGGMLALNEGEWVRLRVPYPLGFYTKWMDGRIDDPNAGWKGRGIWATYSSRAPFHMETGAGTTSKVYKFQMRPNPLAD
jgi:hypothetical protein